MAFPYTYGLYTGQLWTGGVYVKEGEQCWNLLPRMLSGVRVTEYYLQKLEPADG